MKRGVNREQGAVLVVALIMLAMITFLVVAFVGFARFERASVTASMRRTQVEFVAGDSLAMAQRQAVSGLTNTVPHGLLVSKRSGGDLVPVFLDGTGDGIQETESTYLNLNAERNPQGMPGDPFLQQSDPANGLVGDPEWVGLLRNPLEPHGPDNRFIARTAFMTVPVSQGLNVRYHHNPQLLSQAHYLHFRGQNTSPRHINLAAPLFHMDATLFSNLAPFSPKTSYNPIPYRGHYLYGGALYEMGAAIGDAFHLSRPTRGINEALEENRTAGGVPAQVAYWLQTSNNRNSLKDWLGGDGLGNRPYGFYQFMETFSAVELPEENDGLDISSIRDEVTFGYGFPEDHYDFGHVMKFLHPHGLKNGRKLEFEGRGPRIQDEISFDYIREEDEDKAENWAHLLRGGEFELNDVNGNPINPHLIKGEKLKLFLSEEGDDLYIATSPQEFGPWPPGVKLSGLVGEVVKNGDPFSKEISINFGVKNYAKIYKEISRPNGEKVEFIVMSFHSNPGTTVVSGQFMESLTGSLVYRFNPIEADQIPYYVKVRDTYRVSLHRSPNLSDRSRVVFAPKQFENGWVSNIGAGNDWAISYSNNLRIGDYIVFPNGGSFNKVTPRREKIYKEHVFQIAYNPLYLPNNLYPALYEDDAASYVGINDLLLVYDQPKSQEVRVIRKMKIDALGEKIEQSVGEMLNESIFVEGTDFGISSIHLNGKSITSDTDIVPFNFGFGRQQALGAWHNSYAGIPWVKPSEWESEFNRIVQVAANIGDVFSEAPHNRITGKDVLEFRGNTSINPFGEPRSDGVLSAKIRYLWGNGVSRSGLAYGEYLITFNPHENPRVARPGGNIARGRIQVSNKNTGKVLTVSPLVSVSLFEEQGQNGYWGWHLDHLTLKPGFFDHSKTRIWVMCDLKLSIESGRMLSVYLNDSEIINYEFPARIAPRKFGFISSGNCKGTFTDIKPPIKMDSTPKDFDLSLWRLNQMGPPYAPGPWQAQPSPLPSHYKGVFDKESENTRRLVGLQRGERGDSWYKRESPTWIGVKDRGRSPGLNLMPALNEINLRLEYDRLGTNVLGRLSAEYWVPVRSVYPNQFYTELDWDINITGVKLKYRGGDVPLPDIPISPDTQKTTFYATNNLRVIPMLDNKLFEVPSFNPALGELMDVELGEVKIDYNSIIRDAFTGRVVDFSVGELRTANGSRSPVSLDKGWSASGGASDPIFARLWRPGVAYQKGAVVLHPQQGRYYYYQLKEPFPPVDKGPNISVNYWENLYKDRASRKVDLSWQCNDPLVNSRGSDFKLYVYGINRAGASLGQSPSWLSSSSLKIGLGANLSIKNDASQPWGRGVNDPAIKDAGVYSAANWMFPDVLRGGIQNLGWLGQVHRGTPWQTLYLKSKTPGAVEVVSIDDDTGEATTSGLHHLKQGDRVNFTGVKPAEWNNVTSLTNVTGTVAGGGVRSLILDGPSGNALEGLAGNGELYGVSGLFVASNIWTDWAGTSEMQPLNDHRLVEAFRVSGGQPVRGRFDINNPSAIAWSGVLSGLSLRGDKLQTDQGQKDVRWEGLLDNINLARGTGRFARVTDILRVSALTDESPYLPDIIDEQDIERLPQQMLSLLKVGGRRLYQSYIFTEQLRPARQFNRPGSQGGPAVDLATGEVLNYEVVGQTARRVLFELVGAEDWHESLKRGHFGRSRNANGELEDLPMPHPKVLGEWPIRLDY